MGITFGVQSVIGVDKIMPTANVAGQMTSAQVSGGVSQAVTTMTTDNSPMGDVMTALSGVNFVPIILAFLAFFLLGYLLYASMFAAVGSAVDNEADTQQLVLPVTLPLIIGLFIMIHTFQYPDSTLSFGGLNDSIHITNGNEGQSSFWGSCMGDGIVYSYPFWHISAYHFYLVKDI